MKTKYLLSFLAVFAAAAVSGQQPDKSNINISDATADSVTIIKTDSGINIVIKGINGDASSNLVIEGPKYGNNSSKLRTGRTTKPGSSFAESYLQKCADCDDAHTASWRCIIGGFGMGFNAAVDTPDNLDIDMGRSLDISWLYAIGAQYRISGTRNSINVGLGLNWRNFKLNKGSGCFLPNNGMLELGEYPLDAVPKFSELRIFSLTVPVLYRQILHIRPTPFGNMSICFGPLVNFNCRASLKNRWMSADGNETELWTCNIPKPAVTVDALAILYLNPSIGIYARYAPMRQLGHGAPKFSSFTTGLTIGF